MKTKFASLIFLTTLTMVTSCYKDESIDSPKIIQTPSDDPIDQYIQENFVKEYGVAVRYEFIDRYVDANKRVTPPKRELVVPMLDFLTQFWIEPFISVPEGKKFFKKHVPAEMIFIGSPIYNNDGTVTLGTADAGARITLSEVNAIDLDDPSWIFLQLHVIYHEFAHIVHQRYNLPSNWKSITPESYTSAGSWYVLTNEEALEKGFVSNYATSSFNEDYAETASFILFDPQFYENYINIEDCETIDCEKRNEGRVKIKAKYNSVLNHYKQYTGVDLLEVRAIIQDQLQ